MRAAGMVPGVLAVAVSLAVGMLSGAGAQEGLALDGGMMTECTLRNPGSPDYDPSFPQKETVPGKDFGGYWKTSMGLMKLDQNGGMAAGPYGGVGYAQGGQAGKTLQGRWVEVYDDGERKGGTFQWTLYNDDRCFKGTYRWKDGYDQWYGMRIPAAAYGDESEIDLRQSEEARQIMMGGQWTGNPSQQAATWPMSEPADDADNQYDDTDGAYAEEEDYTEEYYEAE